MAQPASRQDLVNYCKRQLGAPVLEINVADEQVDDLIDDALQFFHERHFDGVTQTFLKYKITQEDIDRGRARGDAVLTSVTSTKDILNTSVAVGQTVGIASTSFVLNGIGEVAIGDSMSVGSVITNVPVVGIATTTSSITIGIASTIATSVLPGTAVTFTRVVTTTTSDNTVGIVTTNASTSIVGSAVTFSYEENSNYIEIPPEIIGITKIFKYDGTNTITNNMFSVKYQMFLNDMYYWGATEMLSYAMTKTYLEDMDFLLNTQKQIRFNQRQDRLYLDIDWADVRKDSYFVIDCYRLLDPNDFTRVWNDSFLKRYVTALIKRQWGQNLIKFQGVKLPGGIELNGRQIYDDAQREIELIMEKMSNTYELPPLDMIG